MSDFIPGGRLSAVDQGDQKIQIQTEFSKYPKPRVATTVSIGGMVLHKIQKELSRPIDTLKEQHRVEELINRQHDEVNALVRKHGDVLISQQRTEEPRDPEDATTRFESIIRQAEQLAAAKSAFILDNDGELHAIGLIQREEKLLAAMIRSMIDLLFGIADITKLGKHQDTVLSLGDNDLLVVQFDAGYLIVVTRSDVKKKEILVELERIARAA